MSKHTIDEILRLGKSALQRDRTAYEKAVKGLYTRADTSGFGWNPAGGEADDVDLHDMVDGVHELPRVPGVGRVAVVTMPAYIHEGKWVRRATQRRIYVGHKGNYWRWYSILEDAPVLAVRANPGAVGRSGGSWHKEILDPLKSTRPNPKPKAAVTPTRMNLDVLVDTFGLLNRVPNRLPPTDIAHLRRCMDAGLLVAEGRTHLALTDLGRAARDAHIASHPHLLRASNDVRPNPGPKRRTPAILRHCVAKVAPKRGVSGAYAICTASLQRAGVMRGGKLTAAGKQRDAARRTRTPANKAKDAAFERALRKPRSGR